MIEGLQDSIDAIESGYEFLLAYAAQGRDDDAGSGSGPGVRSVLSDMAAATETLVQVFDGHENGFAWVIVDDAKKTRAALDLVLSHASIGSELVDNLNASIHLRALLTDLFLIGS